MSHFNLKITVTVVIPVNPENYPKGSQHPLGMAAMETKQLNENNDVLLDVLSNCDLSVEVEPDTTDSRADVLNPNNEVAQHAHGQWHKIVALLMHKFGVTTIEIGEDDLPSFNESTRNTVAINYRDHDIQLLLLTDEEAQAALKKEGGQHS